MLTNIPDCTVAPPLVSVMILTCNRPDYLRIALDSVVRQTHRHLEILVCDNASTSETAEVVRSFNDPRIRYHRHPENIGATRNAWYACGVATGKHLANLNDDDSWEPAFLERVIAPMEEHPDLTLAFSDHYIIDAQGEIDHAGTQHCSHYWGRDRLPAGRLQPFVYEALVKLTIPMIISTVYRRGALNFSRLPDLPACYDMWLVYLAVKAGGAAWYVPERLGRVRVHLGSETMKGRDRVARAFIMLYTEFLQDEALRQYWPDFRHPLGLQLSSLGYIRLREGKMAEARDLLTRGMKSHPCLRSFIRLACSYVPMLLTFREFLRRRKMPHSSPAHMAAATDPAAIPVVNPKPENGSGTR